MNGHPSSPLEFISAPRFTAGPHLPFAFRWLTQISLPPNPPGTVPAHRNGSRALGEPRPRSGRGQALRRERGRAKSARSDAAPGEDRAGGSRLRSGAAHQERSKGFGAGEAARSGLTHGANSPECDPKSRKYKLNVIRDVSSVDTRV